MAEHQKGWDEFSPALTYAYNTTVHRAIGCAPFDLVLSRSPTPLFFENAEKVTAERVTPREAKMVFLERLRRLMETAVPKLRAAQARYKADFDARGCPTKFKYVPGQYVFLERETKIDGQEGKLYPKALGTFKVLRTGVNTVTICRHDKDDQQDTLSLDRVVPAPMPASRLPHIVEESPERTEVSENDSVQERTGALEEPHVEGSRNLSPTAEDVDARERAPLSNDDAIDDAVDAKEDADQGPLDGRMDTGKSGADEVRMDKSHRAGES